MMNDMSVLQSAASSEERSTTTRRSRSSSCRPRASTRSISPSPRRCPSSSTSARLPIHPPLARCLRPRTVNLSPHRPPHPTASNHNELNRTNVEFDRWRRWRASVVVRKRSVNNERTSSANASRSRRTCPKPSCKSTSTPGAASLGTTRLLALIHFPLRLPVRRLNDPAQIRKHSKLVLPSPQVSEQEIEEIAKYGRTDEAIEADDDGTGATSALLATYKATPTPRRTAPTPIRTPARRMSHSFALSLSLSLSHTLL